MSLNDNTIGLIVNNVTSDISGLFKYGQVIYGRRYGWLISYMTSNSDGTPTNIRMYFIFLENRSIGLHFAADNKGLSSLKVFWGYGIFVYFSKRGVSAVQGLPRSMNLVPIESAYVTSY